jgi:hypothetical protein
LFGRKHPGIIHVMFAAFKEKYRTQYFTAENISCANCVCICTDGAAAFVGRPEIPV